MTRTALMYCCRSSERCSQLRRTLALAEKLSDSFDVTVIVGAPLENEVEVPDSVTLAFLPALGADPDSDGFDVGRSQELRQRVIARRDALLRVFEQLKPRVVVVEDFPFRQRGLQGEVLPLIERARNGIYGEALVVCLTDGILADRPEAAPGEKDRTGRFLDKYFDMVIVQSDPVFARIEEFYQPRNALQTPVYHAGFVNVIGSAVQPRARIPADTVLVSAGDGLHGGPLYRSAVKAHQILGSTLLLPMKIVAGQQLPEKEWQELRSMADGLPDLTLERCVPDLRSEMAQARWSVSQCDYMAVIDAITTRTPSLFVPSGNGDRETQTIRAQRLVYWGAGRLLLPQHLNGASLANEIHELLRFQPRNLQFDLSGADTAARLIAQAAYHNDLAVLSSRPPVDDRRPH